MLMQINIWMKYLLSKRSEMAQMDYKDALLAQVNIRIYRKMIEKRIIKVPLNNLKFLHPLDRETAQASLSKRISSIKGHINQINLEKEIDATLLDQWMPSVSKIHVHKGFGEDYIVFEGNGRVAALRDALGQDTDILIEVEEYICRNSRNILRMLHHIRKLNGLIKEVTKY